MIEFYVDGIEIGDNPIGGGAHGGKKNCFALECKEWQKNAIF